MTFSQTSIPQQAESLRPKVRRKYPLQQRLANVVSGFISVLRLSTINRYGHSQVCASAGPVVSLTTHGERIRTVHLTIESIGNGSLRPSRLILWLDDARLFNELPESLRRLQKRGLEVRLSKNYGPHTKYYPFLQSEANISRPLVTADDDILYPSYWLQGLADAFRKDRNDIHCYRAREIQVRRGEAAPYGDWPECTDTSSSFRHLATGVSGVLYAPSFLKELKAAGDRFLECCPKADDLWLHVQALRSGYKTRQIFAKPRHFPLIPRSQKVSLYGGNVVNEDGNDLQVRTTYTKEDYAVLLNEAALDASPAYTIGDRGSASAPSFVN